MRLVKLPRIGSVVLLMMLCKVGQAAEPTRFIDGLKLGGYSSAQLTVPKDGETEAAINELSFILSWESDSRFKFLSEFEANKPLTWNDENKFNNRENSFDLERIYLDYNFSEKINIRAGRFLTPTGRWNLLHAAPLEWTTTRPIVTNRLFPNYTNGVMAFGAVPAGEGTFEYSVFVEAIEDEIDNDKDVKFDNVKGARFTFGQDSNIGLNLASFNEKTINNPSYRLVGLDFLTHYQNIEFTGEAFKRWDNHDKDGGSGAYLQTAIPLPGLTNWYGLARLETFHRPDESHSGRWLLGSTWRIKPTQVLKLEFTGGSADQPESPRGFLASFAVLF